MGITQREKKIRENTKVRKSGPSLVRKALKLGQIGNVFALCIYWDTAKRRYRLGMHIPKDGRIPKMNKIVNSLISARSAEPTSDEIVVEVDEDKAVGFLSQDDDMSVTGLGPHRILSPEKTQSDSGSLFGESSPSPSNAIQNAAPEHDVDASGDEVEGLSNSSQLQTDPAACYGPDAVRLGPTEEQDRCSFIEAPIRPPRDLWREKVQNFLSLLDRAQISEMMREHGDIQVCDYNLSEV
ncbi:hypothetical protein BGZ63DRAFT_440734 [Mariannaea sp. PMI_226]|nr:hypothetical protein BGZ63DRAFT_440734 [Mariannaea sp. PMI_226]